MNYFGVVELLEALRPALAASPHPRAAVVSSMASLQPNSPEMVQAALGGDEARALQIAEQFIAQGPQVGYVVYPSSKRALSRWVRRASISQDWAGAGIPLNAVAPGTVLTPMTEQLLSTEQSRAVVDSHVPMPLNYHQPPESVVERSPAGRRRGALTPARLESTSPHRPRPVRRCAVRGQGAPRRTTRPARRRSSLCTTRVGASPQLWTRRWAQTPEPCPCRVMTWVVPRRAVWAGSTWRVPACGRTGDGMTDL